MRPLTEWLATAPAARIAVRFEGRDLSYGELAAQAAACAAWLQAQPGVGAGSRIAWLGHNCPEQLVLLFACAQAGLMLLPFNWRLTSDELAAIAADAEPALLVVEDSCAGLVNDALSERCGGRVVPLPELQQAVATTAPSLRAAPPADTPLLLVYTSGTTGRAKGSVLTQGALAANAANSWHMHGMTADDVVLTTLPMFHVGGLNIQTLPALACSARVLLHPRFLPGKTLAAIESERPTLTVQVPATLQALMHEPGWTSARLDSLRALSTGSTDVPIALIEHLHDRGVPVIQVYGATETCPLAIYQQAEEARATVGSIGRGAPGTEIRLVDKHGEEVADGEPGEILVRGPQVSVGYFRDADGTAAAFRDGWFHTGDVASRDAEGLYWFRDRIKNVIISGGENIYPAEIERLARTVPGVGECAVVGRPDARWGHVPVMYVEASAEGFDEERLRAAFKASLARYKHPAAIEVLPALPRTALGKVDVGTLRARARAH